jgi:hypothetical protein
MSRTLASADALSIALWALPVVVLQVVRARRERPAWAVALDVPLAVALDLLAILALTRLVRLETAVLASRPAWVLAGAALVARRCRRGDPPRWPSAIRRGDVLAAATAGALAVLVCSGISYKYLVWDMEWHIPLVASLAAQKIPFVNALSPNERLHYHFTGDVLAAAFRTLSFDVVSAPRALHTAHDVMFCALAATVALLSIALGLKRRLSAALGALAVILQGPIPLRGGLGHPFYGYAYHDFVNLSYRPHVPLAGLLLVGILGCLAARAASPREPSAATAPVLLAAVALLAVTDETSTALVGLGLGVAWLVDPRSIAATRGGGLLLLLGLGAALVTTNVLFSASLAPGGPVQAIRWVAAGRMPSLLVPDPPLLLSTPEGRRAFTWDFFPLLACAGGLVLVAATARSRALAALAAFVCTLVALCAVAVTHVEINHDGAECQRFFVAPFFAATVLGVLHLQRARRGSLAGFALLLGIAVPAVITAYTTHEIAPLRMAGRTDGVPPWGTERLHDVDCRASVGAHLGDRVQATYVDSSQFFLVAGCRPIFTLGTALSPWPTRIEPVLSPIAQLRAVDGTLVGANQPLDAICSVEGPPADVVCRQALAVRDRCLRAGAHFARCPLTPADRDLLLARAPHPG